MKNVTRVLGAKLSKSLRQFPAVILTGPRRAGKTWLFRHLFPKAQYHLLEDPDLVARIRQDPHGFLDGLTLPVILDEIQNTPELFSYIRARIDQHPRRTGQWLLTGSQEAPLMQGVSESMAGRAAIMRLLPFSHKESSKVSMLRGGFPEVLARPTASALWYSSYLQTYLERDVRAITAVKDLATFRRFISLLATRHGSILNKTELAAPLGVSVPTITQWLGVLETTSQILLVPPFFENLGKRLIKSPKMYIADSGMACHLLGIQTEAELSKSPFLGAIFEGFIAAEIVKSQLHAGMRQEIYHFRDQQGLEVDFIVPAPRGGGMHLIECKAGKTPTPSMAAPMMKLAPALLAKRPKGYKIESFLIHRGTQHETNAISPGVKAMHWQKYFEQSKVSL